MLPPLEWHVSVFKSGSLRSDTNNTGSAVESSGGEGLAQYRFSSIFLRFVQNEV